MKFVMQSNLLSGGLDAEHFSIFSTSTKELLLDIAKATDNKELIKGLGEKSE